MSEKERILELEKGIQYALDIQKYWCPMNKENEGGPFLIVDTKHLTHMRDMFINLLKKKKRLIIRQYRPEWHNEDGPPIDSEFTNAKELLNIDWVKKWSGTHNLLHQYTLRLYEKNYNGSDSYSSYVLEAHYKNDKVLLIGFFITDSIGELINDVIEYQKE